MSERHRRQVQNWQSAHYNPPTEWSEGHTVRDRDGKESYAFFARYEYDYSMNRWGVWYQMDAPKLGHIGLQIWPHEWLNGMIVV